MIVSGTLIATRERTPRSFAIRIAMENAVKQAIADGVNDDDEIKRRILAAREIAKQAFADAHNASHPKSGSRHVGILNRIKAALGA